MQKHDFHNSLPSRMISCTAELKPTLTVSSTKLISAIVFGNEQSIITVESICTVSSSNTIIGSSSGHRTMTKSNEPFGRLISKRTLSPIAVKEANDGACNSKCIEQQTINGHLCLSSFHILTYRIFQEATSHIIPIILNFDSCLPILTIFKSCTIVCTSIY
jgi:hypothetical protein